MATRNLARTVIEVGRTKRSKEGRRHLRRIERRAARRFCYDAETYDDLEDLGVDPAGLPKGWDFEQDDKLGPARRWLDSRVGRLWDDVFSELSVKFRGRGIALSHVVDFHMLEWVDLGAERWYGSYDYVVDDEGILRHGPEHGKPRRSFGNRLAGHGEAARWAGDRRVIVRGKRCYWSDPDRWEVDYYGTGATKVSLRSHRQGREFSPEDYEVWGKLSAYAQKHVSLEDHNRQLNAKPWLLSLRD